MGLNIKTGSGLSLGSGLGLGLGNGHAYAAAGLLGSVGTAVLAVGGAVLLAVGIKKFVGSKKKQKKLKGDTK